MLCCLLYIKSINSVMMFLSRVLKMKWKVIPMATKHSHAELYSLIITGTSLSDDLWFAFLSFFFSPKTCCGDYLSVPDTYQNISVSLLNPIRKLQKVGEIFDVCFQSLKEKILPMVSWGRFFVLILPFSM